MNELKASDKMLRRILCPTQPEHCSPPPAPLPHPSLNLANIIHVTFICFPVQRALHRASPSRAAQTSVLPDTGWHHLTVRAVQRPSKVRESRGPPFPRPCVNSMER